MSETPQQRTDKFLQQQRNYRKLRRQVLTKACALLTEMGIRYMLLSYYGVRECRQFTMRISKTEAPPLNLEVVEPDMEVAVWLKDTPVPQELRLVRDRTTGVHWCNHASDLLTWIGELLTELLPADFDCEHGSEGLLVVDVPADKLTIRHGTHHVDTTYQIVQVDQEGNETWETEE